MQPDMTSTLSKPSLLLFVITLGFVDSMKAFSLAYVGIVELCNETQNGKKNESKGTKCLVVGLVKGRLAPPKWMNFKEKFQNWGSFSIQKFTLQVLDL